MLDQLIYHAANQVHRNGESNAFRRAAVQGCKLRRVDADQFAARVDQGATRVADVDGRIRLDEVLEDGQSDTAAGRTDDAQRDALAEPVGTAYGRVSAASPTPAPCSRHTATSPPGGDGRRPLPVADALLAQVRQQFSFWRLASLSGALRSAFSNPIRARSTGRPVQLRGLKAKMGIAASVENCCLGGELLPRWTVSHLELA